MHRKEMDVLIVSFQTNISDIDIYMYMGGKFLPEESFFLIQEVTHLCKSNKNFTLQ